MEGPESALFLPQEASLELVSVFAPTAVRVTLTQASTALFGGQPEEALDLIHQVSLAEPEHPWALALSDTVLADVRARTVAALDAGTTQDAERWFPICLELDASDSACERVGEWVSIRRRTESAFQAGQMAQASTLAGRCLAITAGDTRCQRIREETASRLAALRDEMEAETPAEDLGQEQPPPPSRVQTDPGPTAEVEGGQGVEAQDTASAGAGAGDSTVETPPAAETAPPELTVRSVSVESFRFSEDQFVLDVEVAAEGPGDASLCVASTFLNQDQEPFRDSDGQFVLGTSVAVLQEILPGPDSSPLRLLQSLPVEQLHEERGPARAAVRTRVFRGPCDAAGPTAPALAEAETEPICVVRYPTGWGVCREE